MQAGNGRDIGAVLKLLGAGGDPGSLVVTGVAFDSRQVRKGNAFICIPGQTVDGNQFVSEAVRNGAACIFSEKAGGDVPVPYFQVSDVRLALALLSDHYFDYPSRHIRAIGVTGTNGKTTTTHLVEHMFNATGRKSGLIGTLGARWPGHESYENIKHTTPQSSDLHQILSLMSGGGVSHVAMEVSSHALAQKRVAGCQFAVACLTNITQDHLDFHQTMEHYWQSKRQLFEMLSDSVHGDRSAVINRDDPLADEFLKACGSGVKTWTYGWTDRADVHVKQAAFDFTGTQLRLGTPVGELDLLVKLTGRFNIYNLMAAIAICLLEGIGKDELPDSLREFDGVAGRFEVVGTGSADEPLCIVDYAHTPDGLDNVLKAARSLVPADGRLLVVFGCGGDRDASKRPQMGEIAEQVADVVIVTSDNPRSEDPQQVIANILAGIRKMSGVEVEPDRSRAIRLAVSQATGKDVVVIAGKGHENYQILADRTIPFDDRTEVRQALAERRQCLEEGSVGSAVSSKQ